jgi:predicted nucleic acid-binding protein
MSDVVIFDTSVLVDEARTGRHRKRIESVEGVVRLSSVVLAEMLRGVIGPAELKFLRTLLRTLARNHPVLTPTQKELA